ncbi:MAG: hypothetical protein AAGD11_03805 [Planctomycetota bacterium]
MTTGHDDRRQSTRAFYSAFARIVGCLLWSGSAGCSLLLTLPMPDDPESFLKAIETAPDSVALEIFQVRVPVTDQKLDAELWQVADEQRVDIDVRHELIRNGFRAGVLGGTVPDRLARYLKLESELPESKAERLITGDNADPTVTRRVVQLDRNESATIQVSSLRDKLNVLMNEEGGLRGRSYEQVQAVYTMRAQAIAGQRIRLRLVPELQHGELRNRYAGSDQGIFLVTPSRERELYDELELSTEMAPGELLILSGLPDASGSLGHAFHAESQRGPAELKVVLIRLVEVPGSEILAETDF